MSTTGMAVSTLLMRPTILLRNEIDRESILLGFCDHAQSVMRYDLSSPFTLGSLTYSTDARVMVRAELSSPIDDGRDILRPPAEETFKQLWRDGLKYHDLELLRLEDLSEGYGVCPACDGRRIPVSQDQWEQYWDDDDFEPDDSTISDRTCEWHWDRRKNEPREKVKCIATIDGLGFNQFYLKKVATIPNVRVAASLNDPSANVGLLQFFGDGFEGMLMGVNWR
jgi:hypothetical protein